VLVTPIELASGMDFGTSVAKKVAVLAGGAVGVGVGVGVGLGTGVGLGVGVAPDVDTVRDHELSVPVS